MKTGKRASRHEPGLAEYSSLIVSAALAEDVGRGDLTTNAIVRKNDMGEAVILAKEDMVVAGLFIAEDVFRRLDRSVVFKAGFKDGDKVKKGKTIATVKGRLGAILTGERVALNFMQRLSGIATLTARMVALAGSKGIKILDTRKTTPCLRVLEKYAVKAGGGHNHRFGLFDSVLVKDNHIKAAGSVAEALRRVSAKYKDDVLVEVEVTNQKELREALAGNADIIMLDNMKQAEIKKALELIGDKALVEVSGGINAGNIKDVAASGVDFISIGGLTHSARSVDISLEVASIWKKARN